MRISKDAKHHFNLPCLCSINSYSEYVQGRYRFCEGIVDCGSPNKILGAPYLNLEGKVVAFHLKSHLRTSNFIALSSLEEWLFDSFQQELEN